MVALSADSHLVLRTYIAMEIIVTLSVLARSWARFITRLPILWDDLWMLAIWAFYTTFIVVVMISSNFALPAMMYNHAYEAMITHS